MSKGRIVKRLSIGCLGFLCVLVVLFLVIVGPWPTSEDSQFREAAYYQNTWKRIDQAAEESLLTRSPSRLLASWACIDMTPEVGVPLAGYGARKDGKNSTGVRDRLHVRALSLSDGKDTVVIIGSDMLIIPPNVADAVREAVGRETPLTANDLLFNASHTHCGPGGFGPGIAAYVTGGKYDPELPVFLAERFTDAVLKAYRSMEAASIAFSRLQATEYIRNRAREAPVDDELDYLVVRQEDGDECFVVRFSAHPTIFGSRMMEFSAEFPGALMRALQERSGASAIYLGGSLGSCSPRAPEGPDDSARVDAMGKALAELVLSDRENLVFQDALDITSVGVPVDMPSLQIRPIPGRPNLRLSPAIVKLIGIPQEGWFQAVRLGNTYLVGSPCDFSGEISLAWKSWARSKGIDVWPLSFSGTYCGYFSPDKYYNETPLGYETGMMSWYGPHIEGYFTDLTEHAVDVLS